MEIKFKKALSQYKYLVMFDLASKVSGVCIWDIKSNKPIKTSVITVPGNSKSPVYDLYILLDKFFMQLQEHGVALEDVLVCQEAMPVQLHGGASTVQTFLSLAKSHAVLDLYTEQHLIDTYDHVGVYPISTHAYLKTILGLDKTYKVSKTDINKYVKDTYALNNLTFDESDAVFLAQTLVQVKWNKDINNEIKIIKRHIKTLKSPSAINLWRAEQKRIEALLI